jgi:uncharacterized membrane protein YukC
MPTSEFQGKLLVFLHNIDHDLVYIKANVSHIKSLKQRNQLSDAKLDELLKGIDKGVKQAMNKANELTETVLTFRSIDEQ